MMSQVSHIAVRALCAAALVASCGSAWAIELVWRGGDATNPTLASVAKNWAPEGVPGAGDTITIDASAESRDLKWDLNHGVAGWTQTADYNGTVTFDSGLETIEITGGVTLEGGKWTHTINPSFAATAEAWTSGRGTKQLIVSVGGAMTIGENATIDVTGMGFAGGQGPGSPAAGLGASHGGTAYNNAKPCYGDVFAPDTLGSGANAGGGQSWWTPGNGHGGGAVRLTVGGKLTVNGTIVADSPAGQHYTGSGGSVFLTAGSFGGSGSISAKGADCTTDYSGAGGRIAVILTGAGSTFEDSSVAMSAAGGSTPTLPNGGNGTIYLETAADGHNQGELVLKGRGDGRTPSEGASFDFTLNPGRQFAFRKVSFSDGGSLVVDAGTKIQVAEIAPVAEYKGESVFLRGGTVEIPSATDFGALRFVCSAEGSVIRPVGVSPVFWVPSCEGHLWNKALTVDGSMVVPSGAKIAHSANATAEGFRVDVTVNGDVTVDAGGAINTEGCGYSSGKGPGVPTATGHQGGSHGGVASGSGGKVYGSLKYPQTSGSGGVSPWTPSGGGVIRLAVDGKLTVDGEISSDSANKSSAASYYYTSAGGSVWITAKEIVGSGNIHADGAKGQNSAGSVSGAGGRVAVTLTKSGADFTDFGGRISAYGACGAKSVPQNGAGTVYLRTGDQGDTEGTLVIDNGGSNRRDLPTPITADVTDTEVGNVLVRNGGILDVTQGGTLTVHGDWTTEADGTTLTSPDGQVLFVDADRDSTISGTNVFGSVSCTVPGKALKFALEGSLFGTAPGGMFILTGSDEAPITLDSTDGVGTWLMALGSGTVQNLSYLTVNRSDASLGAKVVAQHSTGEGNVNWSLVNIEPGETITWTGEESAGFSDAGNWDRGRAPVSTDHVVIEAGTTYSPALSDKLEVDQLVVKAGASLNLNGFDISVREALSVKGEMKCVASERIDIVCDAEIAGFVGASSAIHLKADGDQTVDFGGCALYGLFVENGGDLSLNGGFSSDLLECRSSVAKSLTFEAGESFAARRLTIAGPTGGTDFITLASSVPGTAWAFQLGDTHTVSGVSVSDSDARGGRKIYPSASANAGRNENWDFAKTTSVWVGGSGNDFNTAENWNPVGVPDETTRILLDAGVSVQSADPVSVFSLEIRNGQGPTTLTTKGKLTVSDMIVIGDGGTLVADAGVETDTMIIQGNGVVTHTACTAAGELRLDLAVSGDLRIEKDGRIDVTAKGYPKEAGPGFNGTAGATYGGQGAYSPTPKPCYGSILNPLDPGSGGNTTFGSPGGGVVKIVAEGSVVIDGMIVADAGPGLSSAAHYNGAGGSVNITCGTLAGSGSVTAIGGRSNATTESAGGGGRIAVRQMSEGDVSACKVILTAHGGLHNTKACGAAGTVYEWSAGSKIGTVTIDNDYTATFPGYYAQLPMADDGVGAYKRTAFVLKEAGMLKLTDDVTVYDVDLADANVKINLNGHTLSIISKEHKNRKGWLGTVIGDGKIEWLSGLMVIVR